MFSEAPSRARRIVQAGDTIISTVRKYLKAIAYIDDNKTKGNFCRVVITTTQSNIFSSLAVCKLAKR